MTIGKNRLYSGFNFIRLFELPSLLDFQFLLWHSSSKLDSAHLV